MRYLALLVCLLLLGACASPLPARDPGMAWVDLYTPASDLLMAEELDGKRLNDGRYFQVSPGAHTLDVRFQFEVAGGGGGSSDFNSEPRQMTCHLRLQFLHMRGTGGCCIACG